MNPATDSPGTTNPVHCAIYTRKSTQEGLDEAFTSLDAQRQAAEAYILSQQQAGWRCLPEHYDDGGYSGSNLERPALQQLLTDIAARKIDCVVTYKVECAR
jgi:site-specific DNA recombinase